MFSPAQHRTPARRVPTTLLRILAVAAAAIVLLATALADTAGAHGSTINPASRNYGCWKRWGGDFQNPRMATEDPMCWQAWQADPNAMWNWNGLYRDGVAGNHQAAVPNGQLCSAGQTGGVRYAALDNPGAWQATPVGSTFGVTVHDQALHGADYFRIYVTRPGFNPLTQRLTWNDIELVRETGRYGPGAGTRENDPVLNGVSNTITVSAPGRTGRHVVYTIWKASHSDQTYYWCSDVTFGGSGGNPDPTTSPTPRPTTPTPTSTPPRTPPATTPPAGGSGSCSATYTVTGSWSGGFQADIRVTAGSAAITGWTVTWTFANGQQISNSWGATVSASGSVVTARNTDYNGSLGAVASTTFGFLGSWTGSNAVPTLNCTAT